MTRPFSFRRLALSAAIVAATQAQAVTIIPVSTEAELRDAISLINMGNSTGFIELRADITLTQALPPLRRSINIDGNNRVLTGGSTDRLLDVGDGSRNILVSMNDLVLAGGLAQGAPGSDGQGGAVRVNDRANVVVQNVKVGGAQAAGGDAPMANGGHGLGGAFYVAQGGQLTLSGTSVIAGNAVTAGTGGLGNGQAVGAGVFLNGSGSLQINGPREGNTLTVTDAIADGFGSGVSANPDDQWHVVINGAGGDVVLSGDNAYSGETYINNAILVVEKPENLGASNSAIVINEGGIALADQLRLERDVLVRPGGAVVRVDDGVAEIAGSLIGRGFIEKTGEGNLRLDTIPVFDGSWMVSEGMLLLDSDARLGSSNSEVILAGGGILFEQDFDDLRALTVAITGTGGQEGEAPQPSTLNNGGHTITLANDITGGGDLRFAGGGTFHLTGAADWGSTLIAEGRVIGNISGGSLTLNAGASYELGGANRTVADLAGAGQILLGGNRLTLALGAPAEDGSSSPAYAGVIHGSGGVSLQRTDFDASSELFPLEGIGDYRTYGLSGTNTYSGGTQVGAGVILGIGGQQNIGSGPLALAGGAVAVTGASSDINLELQGGGGIVTVGQEQTWNGVISGTGTLVKAGPGTLILNNDNTYVGDTLVYGEGSLLALAHPGALGTGTLTLTQGGGLKLLTSTTELRPIRIGSGVGVVDTGSHSAQSTGFIQGSEADSVFAKDGSGTFVVTGAIAMQGGTQIRGGILQVGDGGGSGSIAGDVDIAAGAQLVVDRAGSSTINGVVAGDGAVVKRGSGTLLLGNSGFNVFTGGLTVEGGWVAFSHGEALGVDDISLNGGGLAFGGDLDRDVNLGALNGGFDVAANAVHAFSGDTLGQGGLLKTGDGTLVLTGVAEHAGGTRVADGTLQIGEGLRGILTGNVQVDSGATLAFGRDDLTIYESIISGAGNVVKKGVGELVLTGNSDFSGTLSINVGSLRIGYGGTTGSIRADVNVAQDATLVFDRSDHVVHEGDIAGDGGLLKNGPGILALTGNAAHTGGTVVNAGALQLGLGGTEGSISGTVQLLGGSQFIVNRSDTLTLNAMLTGTGSLVQAGSGTTILQNTNQLTGFTWIRDGAISTDADAKLGQAEVILDGGAFAYNAAFNDLRSLRLTQNGGGLDTGAYNVFYAQQITGPGQFEKLGSGKLTLTGLLATGSVAVREGELQVGNADNSGTLLGNVVLDASGTLAFARNDAFSFTGQLTGSGTLVQRGTGELHLGVDNNLFAGTTRVEQGSLVLNNVLGGNMQVAAGATLMGTGELLGNLSLDSGALLKPGNSIGALRVGGNISFADDSLYEVEINGAGATDRVDAGGIATLDGDVKVLTGGGEYRAEQRYTILSAGTLVGDFDSVSSDLLFLNARLEKVGGEVQLIMTRNGRALTSVALTRNQQATANGIAQLSEDSDLATLVLNQGTAEGARRLYDSFSGDGLLAQVDGQARLMQSFNDVITRRSSRMGGASTGALGLAQSLDVGQHWLSLKRGSLPTLPQAADEEDLGLEMGEAGLRVEGVWAEARSLQFDLDADSSLGSPDSASSGQLLSLGVDAYWSDAWAVGLGLGLADLDSDASARRTKAQTQSWLASAYSRWDSESGWHLKSSLSFAQSDITTERLIKEPETKLTGSTTGQSLSLALEAGMGLQLWRVALRPFAGLTFHQLEQDGYSERGGEAGLDVASIKATQSELRLGMDMSRVWLSGGQQWLQLGATLALAQPFGDTQLSQTASFSGTGASFTVMSAADDSTALQLRAGAAWFPASRFSIWGGYEGRQSSASSQNQGVLSLNYLW